MALGDFWNGAWLDVYPTFGECVGFFVPTGDLELDVSGVTWIVALRVDEVAHYGIAFVVIVGVDVPSAFALLVSVKLAVLVTVIEPRKLVADASVRLLEA